MVNNEIIEFQRDQYKDLSLHQWMIQEKTKKDYVLNQFLKKEPGVPAYTDKDGKILV
jgi:hypothetical protein